MQLVLAFTGDETPRAVNVSLLLSAVIFLLVGGWTRAAARPIRAAVVTSGNDLPRLMDGVLRIADLHGAIGWVLALACLGTGIDLALFLARIVGRLTRG